MDMSNFNKPSNERVGPYISPEERLKSVREKHKDKGLLPPSCASQESTESTVRGLGSNNYATQDIAEDNNNITSTRGSTKNPSSSVPSLPSCKKRTFVSMVNECILSFKIYFCSAGLDPVDQSNGRTNFLNLMTQKMCPI